MNKTVSYINKTTLINQNNVVAKSERIYYYQPKTEFQGGSIRWFDDSKLIKK